MSERQETGRERLARIEGAITAAVGFATQPGFVDPDVPWLLQRFYEASRERDRLLAHESSVGHRINGILSAAGVPPHQTVFGRVDAAVRERDELRRLIAPLLDAVNADDAGAWCIFCRRAASVTWRIEHAPDCPTRPDIRGRLLGRDRAPAPPEDTNG